MAVLQQTQQTWSESYASFDVSEWVTANDGHAPDTIEGSGDEETLEVSAMPDVFASLLHGLADHPAQLGH